MSANLLTSEYIRAQRTNIATVEDKIPSADKTRTDISERLVEDATYATEKNILLNSRDAKSTELENHSNDNNELLTEATTTINSNDAIVKYNYKNEIEFVVNGEINKFYPVWFLTGTVGPAPSQIYGSIYIDVIRTSDMDRLLFANDPSKTPTVYMHIDADSTDRCKNVPTDFKVRNYSPKHVECIAIPNKKLYCSKTRFPWLPKYQHPVLSGFYVRGGIKFKIFTDSEQVSNALIARMELPALDEYNIQSSGEDDYYCRTIKEEHITHIPWGISAYNYPTEYAPLVGDTGLLVGGTSAGDIITRNEIGYISTKAATIGAGNLSFHMVQPECASNGGNDICVTTGDDDDSLGNSHDAQSIVSTGSDTLTTAAMSKGVSLSKGTSNNVSDVAVFTGGVGSGVPLTDIRRVAVPTVAEHAVVGNLLGAVVGHVCDSNGTLDQAVVVGGHELDGTQSSIVQQFIISTGSNSAKTADLTTYTKYGESTSIGNSVGDQITIAGGKDMENGDVVIPHIYSSVVSTGADVNTTSDLSIATATTGGTSNGTGDIGTIYGVGGDGGVMSDELQQLVVSTGTYSSQTNNVATASILNGAASNA